MFLGLSLFASGWKSSCSSLLSVDMQPESCHHVKSESCGDEGHAWRGGGGYGGCDINSDVGNGKHGENDSLDEISLRKYRGISTLKAC